MKGYAPRLALKKRYKATRKWSILIHEPTKIAQFVPPKTADPYLVGCEGLQIISLGTLMAHTCN